MNTTATDFGFIGNRERLSGCGTYLLLDGLPDLASHGGKVLQQIRANVRKNP